MVDVYDRIGLSYSRYRRPDPRIAARIDAALGDAVTVLDVGAGAGSYETGDRRFVALEPSQVMLAQRPPGAAPAVRGTAERLPFADAVFDAAMAVFTVHHWADPDAGLAEVRRVTRGPVVVLTWDPGPQNDRFWMVADYLPELRRHQLDGALATAVSNLAPCRVEPVPVPHDCTDGFFAAYWRRPAMYLDAGARAAISALALLDPPVVERMTRTLAADLASGEWERRHADLLTLDAWDAGYRLVVAPGNSGGNRTARR